MSSPGALARWTAPAGAWTEPDLHLFPQDGHRYEVVDGSLHVTPPPDATHESIVRALVTTLRGAAPEGWWVCARLGVACAGSHLIPDVTVLRPDSSGAVWSDPADVALVVEVETAESSRYDRLLKPALYAEAGIAAYWRIEAGPAVQVHELSAGGYTATRRITGPDLIRLDTPFPIRVSPSAWL